jgi:hypothetical protein
VVAMGAFGRGIRLAERHHFFKDVVAFLAVIFIQGHKVILS